MKNRIYNVIQTCFLVFAVCFLLGSCMSDTINLDPDKVQEKELDKDNLRLSHIVVMGTGEPFDNYDAT